MRQFDPDFDRPFVGEAKSLSSRSKKPWIVVESHNALEHFKAFLFFLIVPAFFLYQDFWFLAMVMFLFDLGSFGGGVLVETHLSRHHGKYYVP